MANLKNAFVSEMTRYYLVRGWLLLLCLQVLAVVAIGGMTRLTESGLSMVDWRPVYGVLPPVTDAQWDAVFSQYKKFPQYQKVNHGMSMAEFKVIFFWEYLHRILARLLGVVFLLPFIFFVWKKWLSRRQQIFFFLAFVLGGLQGLLGWYMVRSGLIDVPRVSHFRLAAHLSLALLVLVYLYWLFLDFRPQAQRFLAGKITLFQGCVVGLTVLVVCQIVTGALLAGLRGGHGFRTFPTMNGSWLPPGGIMLSMDMLSQPGLVQFVHRGLAWACLFAAVCLWVWGRYRPLTKSVRMALNLVAVLVGLQFSLGVVTLLSGVHIALAVSHQMGACILLLTLVFLCYRVLRIADRGHISRAGAQNPALNNSENFGSL